MASGSIDTPAVFLLIDELQAWRGTEGHLFRLLKALHGKRFNASLGVLGEAGLAAEFRSAGIPVHELAVNALVGLRGLHGARTLAGLVRSERTRLLVSYHTASDLLAPIVASVVGIPTISCRRDEGFTKQRRHVLIQRLVNRRVDGMISVSDAVARAVNRTEGFPMTRNLVIWNGEDLQLFKPGPATRHDLPGIGSQDCVVACVAGLSPQKDHATLLRAFSLAIGGHPEARLVIVGDGVERERLLALAQPLGERVLFLGARRDVADILRMADIYAQTSTTEGFSNSVLQAMATGLPVVATRVGGNPELVAESCGMLVTPGDAQATARALTRLMRDRELRQRFGQAARQRVERYGSLERMASLYADAFDQAIKGPCWPPVKSGGQA